MSNIISTSGPSGPHYPVGVNIGTTTGDIKVPQEDTKPYKIDRSWHKEFSKDILAHKIEEYKAGKYSQKYIETYLDFMHLEGIIDNLQYLEYKNQLQEIK